MSTPISKTAQAAQDAARLKTGEFGTQTHAESGIVQPAPRSNAESHFTDPRWAYCGDDPHAVRAWAAHDGISTQNVETRNVEMAMFTLGREGSDEMDANWDLPEAERWAMADQYLCRVWAEAGRRQNAETIFDRNRWNRIAPTTVRSANRALNDTMDDAVRLGLLPPGTTVTSYIDGEARCPYTSVRLEGMTDRQARVSLIDDDGGTRQLFSPYGHAVNAFLSKVAADTETSLTRKPAWPQVQIETKAARIKRVRDAEKAAGTRWAAAVAESGDKAKALADLQAAAAAADEARQA